MYLRSTLVVVEQCNLYVCSCDSSIIHVCVFVYVWCNKIEKNKNWIENACIYVVVCHKVRGTIFYGN